MAASVRYVVAIDFGTTFSGFAFMQRRTPGRSTVDIEGCSVNNGINVHYNWPDRAGRQYCKTPTALFYVSDEENGPFELVQWGWSAENAYATASRMATTVYHSDNVILLKLPTPPCQGSTSSEAAAGTSHTGTGSGDNSMVPPPKHYALFARRFKIPFLKNRRPLRPEIPSPENLVVDYLSQMREFIMKYLSETYDNYLGMDAVEWCLTVPYSVASEKAKQKMKECAEKAGLVQGNQCPRALQALASPFPIDLIFEPEAASIYCQEDAGAKLHLRKGDRILVADAGGGTIDLVLHTKLNDDPANLKVEEAVESFGEYGGGTYVDKAFLTFLSTKIDCFDEVKRREPNAVHLLLEWWEGKKKSFRGQKSRQFLDINQKISRVWREHDIASGKNGGDRGEEFYSEIILEPEDMRKIFDSEVDKVVSLIERHLTRDVKVVMVVGGFASSSYLTRRIREKLIEEAGYKGDQIITPVECESAICRGAVRLHLHCDRIESRISRKTFGIKIHRRKQKGDPQGLLFTREDGVSMCKDCFKVFVERGKRVPMNESYRHVFTMATHDQTKVEVVLYSSVRDRVPKYVSEEGCILEGRFEIDVQQEGMQALGKKRQLEISMVFGASSMSVKAVRKNFGDTQQILIGPSNISFNDTGASSSQL